MGKGRRGTPALFHYASRDTAHQKAKRAASAALNKLTNRKLLAILLDARRAQPREPVLIDRILPGQEFFDRERVACARFFQRQQAPANGRNDLRLAPDDPAFWGRRRQVRDRQRTAIWPDHIFDPRAVG